MEGTSVGCGLLAIFPMKSLKLHPQFYLGSKTNAPIRANFEY